ncbi:MAG: hypothetical protein MUC83_03350 [Pirellula sp.]|nr:hypothetical protein [Pirellula sp.]
MTWNVDINQKPSGVVGSQFNRPSRNVKASALGRSWLLVLLGTAFVGCQQLGMRPTGFYADEDEWGTPPSNVSQVPRPYIETKRNKQTTADSSVKTSLSDSGASKRPAGETSASAPSTPQQSQAATPLTNPSGGTKQEDQALKRNVPGLVDTGTDDVDLDAALDGLPPEYQEILKRQLAASKKHATPAVQSLSDSPASEKVAQESSGNKVSFRLSDNQDEAAVAKTVLPDETSVVAASATANTPEFNTVPAASSIQNTDGRQSVVSAVGSTAVPSPAAQLPLQNTSQAPATPQVGPSNNVAASTSPMEAVNSTSRDSSLNWNQSVNQAITALEKQMETSPAADENLRLHQELTLRMLYASLRKPEEAMQPISGLSDEENEYYRNQMLALIEASNPDAMPVRSRHLSLVMDSQRKATGFLAAASNLEVRNIAFCTDVERYGVVTKFPKNQFKPDDEVLLYCEVDTVSALPDKDGFDSQLQGSYEILDANGNRIVEQTLPMEPDVCQNVRRDYYMVYRIFMPQQISPGNYKLRLTIEDLKARKYGQSTLDLQIKK